MVGLNEWWDWIDCPACCEPVLQAQLHHRLCADCSGDVVESRCVECGADPAEEVPAFYETGALCCVSCRATIQVDVDDDHAFVRHLCEQDEEVGMACACDPCTRWRAERGE